MSEVIPHWLSKQAYLVPNKIAIETEDGEEVTFLELKKRSQDYARRLAQIGVHKGSHIGILSTNNIPMIIAVHALSYLGAVAVLLNTKLTRKELSYQIQDAEVSLLLMSEDMIRKHEKEMFPLPVQPIDGLSEKIAKQIPLQEELLLSDTFTMMYTSGTTGPPKGVMHTYGNHWWSAIGSMLNLGLDHEDKWLAMLPMFHIGGLSIYFKSVIYGMSVYMMETFDESRVNQAILTKGITIASVVTVMLQRIIKQLANKDYPSHFRCMLLGGGPAPITLLEQAKEKHIPVFQSYGMTETSSQIVTLSPEDALKKIGSAGKPLFPGQLKINQPGKDSIGEIFVKGPMVSKGYFKHTKEIIQDEWLATGDLGYLDETGYLYVVDRRTDLIISGGENIYPTEVENALASMKEVKEVGVVGKKDDIWGEVPVAFIVPDNQAPTLEEVVAHVQTTLAKYKIPKDIFIVDSLPRNASNKLMRQKLLEKMN